MTSCLQQIFIDKLLVDYSLACRANLRFALTVGDIGWREVVINEKGTVFGDTEVHDVRSGLQCRNCLFMSHFLQARSIYLHGKECKTMIKHQKQHRNKAIKCLCRCKTVNLCLNLEPKRENTIKRIKNLSYSDKFIPYLQSPVFVCSPSFDNFGHIDAVVTRNVLVTNTACYAEP